MNYQKNEKLDRQQRNLNSERFSWSAEPTRLLVFVIHIKFGVY